MIVALHSAPRGFFRTGPPYSNDELLRFVRKASSLSFKAVQISPLNFVSIESGRLRRVLDGLNMERNVHVGGIYDAEKLALTEEEYARAQKQIHWGITLCKEISSTLVSIHPPLFAARRNKVNEELLSKARTRFLKLVKGEVNFASRNQVKIALESFCYHPFIFEGLHDFVQFVSEFPPEKLGVLLDMGHVYQIGIDLSEAVHLFKPRLLDIHVHDATLQEDFRKATHLPIGKGTINFPDFINLLREDGYNGWLTLEIRGNEREIIKSKEYLENLITSNIE